MGEAKDNYTPAQRPPGTPISISEAANRVLKFYPARIAGQLMGQGFASGQIRVCSYRELVGHHAPEPAPDSPAFWKPDPRGQTRLTPFPWPEDCARRSVQPRGYRRPLCAYTALGLMVVWEDVVAMFPEAARLTEMLARDAVQGVEASTATEPKIKPTRRGKQTPRLLPVLRELYPPDGIPPDHVKTVTVMQRVLKVYKARGWGEVSRDVVERAIGRRES